MNIGSHADEPAQEAPISIQDLGSLLTITTCQIYEKVLDKLGNKLSDKFLTSATEEEKQSFVKRLKEAQIEKLTDRLSLLMNRVLTDHHFLKSYEEIMSPHKSLDDLRQDNEIANNHLQSIENERSILQRDCDMAIEKLDDICESILESKLMKPNVVNNDKSC